MSHPNPLSAINTYLIEIKGLVQGVGFRPFIYRIAKQHDINGLIENRNDGVILKMNCDESKINNFISTIRKIPPPASRIESIEFRIIEKTVFNDLKIVKSKIVSDLITEISPDIAVCKECLEDMNIQKNRISYPFVNCTNCGPRFTIIKDIPYDRDKTTMNEFKMCADCYEEYYNIKDRRFHAQPIACALCGPKYSLMHENKVISDIESIINDLVLHLENQKIVGIKGMGGFFLACDASAEETVSRLRKLKNREGKPFAVMFPNIDTLKKYALVNPFEENSLLSWKRPIVLLKQKKCLAPSVSIGFDTIGAMLPYMPIHHLLFQKLEIPAIVLTSGNLSEEPIVIDNKIAIETLYPIVDAILTYDREIYNRTDDSVLAVFHKKERVFRRSRGFVPIPINTNINVDGIIATGAELVNCFCIGKDKQAILSQHIGDLKNIGTYEFFCDTIEKYKKLFCFNPKIIVSDLHPDYLSTHYASISKLNHIQVQHHHAHIASCMAEHKLDEKVIGVAFDGSGYGDDNNSWGSEFLICDLKEYNRFSHFDYIPMPGSDKVTKEPWRMAISYLYKTFGNNFWNFDLPFLKNINRHSIELICSAIDAKVNSPLTSSAGRLFDAVAAMTNLCLFNKFQAEAPMRLENVIDKRIKKAYPFSYDKTISLTETIQYIVKDIKQKIPIPEISAKFHNTIISIISEVVKDCRDKYQINKLIVSGGTFQNRYLLEKLEETIFKLDFEMYSHQSIPTNDGGIALGQIVIAGKNNCS